MADEQREIGQPQREKFWAELDDSGKLERMRDAVKSLMRKLRELESEVRDAVKHDHLNGQVVLPATCRRNYSAEVGNTAREWF